MKEWVTFMAYDMLLWFNSCFAPQRENRGCPLFRHKATVGGEAQTTGYHSKLNEWKKPEGGGTEEFRVRNGMWK